MGYELRAVVAADEAMRLIASQYEHAFTHLLVSDLYLMPHVWPFVYRDDPMRTVHDEHFWWLETSLFSSIVEASEVSPVAYIESDYFGGTGGQAAAVWRDGQIIFGPKEYSYTKVEKYKLPPPKKNGPISQALRHLGVRAERGKDEFATARLDRHRHTLLWTPQEWRDEFADGYI